MPRSNQTPNRSILVVGGSRGLGEAIVETYVERGAHVVATVRGDKPSPLLEFARAKHDVEVEHVDVADANSIIGLADRLAGRRFDLLFVVAGISLAALDEKAAEITDTAFTSMMITNALGPIRVVEGLQHLVDPKGTIAVMSSGQGSVADNTTGGFEVYRATKSALNQLMRSYAARHQGEARTLLLMAPGWVRTELGGPGARLEISESIPPLVDTIDAQRGIPGLQYLDRFGQQVRW